MRVAATAASAEDAWPARGPALYALAVLLVAYVFSFVDRIIMSMMVAPIQRELGLNDTGLSLLHGFAFALFYTAAGLPIGRLVDRGSRHRIAAAGIFIWSLMTAACGAARGFTHLLLARVGVGIGEATLSPAAYSMIADYFPPQRRSLALAVYASGASIGAGAAFIGGGWLVGLLLQSGPVTLPLLGETSAWRLTFAIVGLPGVLVAALMLSVREPRRRIAAGQESVAAGAVLAELHRRWPAYVTVLLGFTLVNLPFNALIAWGPSYLMRVHNADATQAGLAMGLAFLLFGSVGLYVGGWLADRALARGVASAHLRIGVISALATVPALIGLALAPSLALAFGCLNLAVFAMVACIGAGPPALQLLSPNRLRGQLSAVYMLALNLIGMGLGPTVVALLTDYAFADPTAVGRSLAAAGVIASLAAVAVLTLGRRAFERAVTL